MDKEGVIHTHTGILLSYKKDKMLPFVNTWIDLEGIMLSEISQAKKVQKLYYVTHVE